jgi:hypothetical protein
MMNLFHNLSFQKGLLFTALFLGFSQISLAQSIGGTNTTIEPSTATSFAVTLPSGSGNCFTDITYLWTVTGGGVMTNSTSNTMSCFWDCNFTLPGIVTVSVKINYKDCNGDGIEKTLTKNYTLKGIPGQFAVSGAASVAQCDNRTITLSAASYGDANLFNWTTTNANIIGSSTGSSIVIQPTSNLASMSAVCTARMSTAPASCLKSFTKYIDRVAPTISVNTSATYLCQGSTITASVSGSTANLSAVNWALPAGYSIVGNPAQPRTSITITATTSAVSGTISVNANYTGGCVSNTVTKAVTIYTTAPPPAVPASALETDIENEPLFSNNCFGSVINSHSLSNVYTNGITTITPVRLIFKRANEIKTVSICYKNLCTNTQSCRAFQVQAPACFNDISRTAPNHVEILESYEVLGTEIENEFVSLNNGSVLANRNTNVAQNTFTLYPNPTNGKVTIYASENIKNIRILDIQGRLVLENNTMGNMTELDLSFANSGIYIVQIATESEIINQKLVLAKE